MHQGKRDNPSKCQHAPNNRSSMFLKSISKSPNSFKKLGVGPWITSQDVNGSLFTDFNCPGGDSYLFFLGDGYLLLLREVGPLLAVSSCFFTYQTPYLGLVHITRLFWELPMGVVILFPGVITHRMCFVSDAGFQPFQWTLGLSDSWLLSYNVIVQ